MIRLDVQGWSCQLCGPQAPLFYFILFRGLVRLTPHRKVVTFLSQSRKRGQERERHLWKSMEEGHICIWQWKEDKQEKEGPADHFPLLISVISQQFLSLSIISLIARGTQKNTKVQPSFHVCVHICLEMPQPKPGHFVSKKKWGHHTYALLRLI